MGGDGFQLEQGSGWLCKKEEEVPGGREGQELHRKVHH